MALSYAGHPEPWTMTRIADVDELEQIVGNPAIEKAAIKFVIACERRQGRTARDARGSGLGGAGDVESDGRIIEVKAFSKWGLKSTGLLLFTPAQLREGERNADYYVYIVENVAQGDPSTFELRELHGEDLRRLLAGAKPQRFYVPVRAADYARLTRLCVEPKPPHVDGENGGDPTSVSPGKKRPVVGGRRAQPIRDMGTGKEYRSKAFFGEVLQSFKQRMPGLTSASRVGTTKYFTFAAGRTGFVFRWYFMKTGFQVELFIDTGVTADNKGFFDALLQQKSEIETKIGMPLEWERLNEKSGCRIAARLPGRSIDEEPASLRTLRDWGVETMVRFAEVFRPRLQVLQPAPGPL